MLVTVLIDNAWKGAEAAEKIQIAVEDHTTIQDLLNAAGYEMADLSHYYRFSRPFAWSQEVLPYLFCKGKVLYDVQYADATVSDFFKTHGIDDATLRIVVGYPQAGGPGFLELGQLWDRVYPVLEQVVTVVGMAQIAGSAVKRICDFFRKRKRRPQAVFDIVFSRKQWNASELSEMLELPYDQTKELLVVCAYRYDRKKRMYVATEQSAILAKKFADVNVFEID